MGTIAAVVEQAEAVVDFTWERTVAMAPKHLSMVQKVITQICQVNASIPMEDSAAVAPVVMEVVEVEAITEGVAEALILLLAMEVRATTPGATKVSARLPARRIP